MNHLKEEKGELIIWEWDGEEKNPLSHGEQNQ